DREVAAAMDASLDTFRKLGAAVVDVDLPDLSAWNAAGTIIIAAEAAAYHGNWLRTRAQDYSEQLRGRLEQGLAIPAASYIDALRMRGVALREFSDHVFSKVDVLHAPIVSFPTPTIAETDIGAGEAAAKLLARVTRLTRPGNYLGLPAVCAVAGFSERGMPIGMQLLARPWDETSALRAGHAFQRAT